MFKKKKKINGCIKKSQPSLLLTFFSSFIFSSYIPHAPSLPLLQSRTPSPPTTCTHGHTARRTRTHAHGVAICLCSGPCLLHWEQLGRKRLKVSLGSQVQNPTSPLLSPAVLLSIKWSHNIALSADGLPLLLRHLIHFTVQKAHFSFVY